MLDTGILRYFFTGGRNLLIMVNGRPYATTASDLDTIPLSAVERIEVLRAESLGTVGGQAAVRGAFNLVLRTDLEGFDVRTVTRIPSRDGGEARQGSVVWGGKIGDDGHMTVGLDVFSRDPIPGASREHSRSEWTKGGSFADSKNISVGGNTLYIYDVDVDGGAEGQSALRSFALGDCDEADGYTGVLSNPPGIYSGDKGCGFAYGDIWWNSSEYEQENVIINVTQPLDNQAEFHLDANLTQARSAFRYAPSVGLLSFEPKGALLNDINMALQGRGDFTATEEDAFLLSHRYIGHGNRDWRSKYDEYDASASITGLINDELGYDVQISAFSLDGVTMGDTFVSSSAIKEEIEAGNYDLTDPLSTDKKHQEAIKRSSAREEDDWGAKYSGARFALEGVGPGSGERNSAWTAGIELSNVEAHSLLEFRRSDGSIIKDNVKDILGSGGTSYAGERDTAGAFAELSLPLATSVDVRAAARVDDYDDIGTLRAYRLGTEYHASELVTLRGSWSTGDDAPSMYHLHAEATQGYPYVRCIPGPDQWGSDRSLPRTCDSANYVQVKRRTSGNPDLKPSDSKRVSIGAEARKGPFYFVADWYQLTTSDLPGRHTATWEILNRPECKDGMMSKCIERSNTGQVTIHTGYENIVKTEISALNTRFGARKETDWGFIAMRGFWRYVDSSEQFIVGQKRKYPLPRSAVRIVPSIGWGDFTVFLALNYRSEIENQSGGGQFSSWTGHDLTFDWKNAFGAENLRLTAGVYNLTDTKLSINTTNPAQFDGPTSAGWGRTYFATVNWRF